MRGIMIEVAPLMLVTLLACSDDAGTDATAGSGGSAAGGGGGGNVAGGGGNGGMGGVGGQGVSGSGADAGTGGGTGGSDAGGAECGAPCGEPSGYELGCCDGVCTGLYNDPKHCGECDNTCEGAMPYCDNGECKAAPCGVTTCQATETCCGGACCTAGQLCCGVNVGPFVMQCHTPTEAEPSCPIGCPSCVCASPDTPIRTPDGERAIASLAVGDLVYSVDHGRAAIVPLAKVSRTPALNHHVVRVVLGSGAVLEISAPHPTADGRTFAELSPGDALGGLEVASVETVPYGHPFTHDILPASDSGTYFAGGALIGSTLSASPESVTALAGAR